MDIKITPALLRRTPKAGRSIFFEAVLDGEVIGSRTSGTFDFYGALYGRYNSTDTWSVIGYFGRPDLLEAGKRKALATLKWPKELAVATVPTLEQRATEFNERYRIGQEVLYQDDHGKRHDVFVQSPAWVIPSGAVLVRLYGLPSMGGYNIDRVHPVPELTTTVLVKRYRNYSDASSFGAAMALYFNLEHVRDTFAYEALRSFARQVQRLGYLPYLRHQFACYKSHRALTKLPDYSWRTFINADGDPLAGEWNARDWEAAAHQAQVASAHQVPIT